MAENKPMLCKSRLPLRWRKLLDFALPLIALCIFPVVPACSGPAAAPESLTADEDREVSIVFLGDTSFQDRYLDLDKFNPIENTFDPILQEADYVIDNLEAPITDVRKSPFSGTKLYVHSLDSKVTPILLNKLHINSVSLANNHMMDYGAQGLRDTMYYLGQQGTGFFGAGDNISGASEPLCTSFKVNNSTVKLFVIAGFQYFQSYDDDYSFYAGKVKAGVSNLNDQNIVSAIHEIRLMEPDSIIVIYPHWGIDYQWKNNDQDDLAVKFIRAGADIIIGHGSHTIQEIEYVNKALVVYGIGNFIFSSSGRYAEKKASPYSFITRMIVSTGQDDLRKIKLRLYPIVTDNLLTAYKPRFTDQDEFAQVLNRQLDMSGDLYRAGDTLATGKDGYGYYMELPVRR